jgi:hypothetical protein
MLKPSVEQFTVLKQLSSKFVTILFMEKNSLLLKLAAVCKKWNLTYLILDY